MNLRNWWSLAICGVLAVGAGAPCFAAAAPAPGAAPKPERPTYTDPAKAGPDYAIQGEYLGEAGGAKLGCQVIALGDSQFKAVFLPGGLPGAGSDNKVRIEVDGKTIDGKTTFAGAYTAAIVDGAMTGKTDKGDAFTLKHTVRHSPTEGAKAPAGAIVLFDGSNVDLWSNKGDGGDKPTRQLMDGPDGQKVINTAAGNVYTAQKFTDFTLHVEFYLPFKPFARGQERGNSGVYVQNRYEIQVLDSFGLKGLNNECAGIYTKSAPSVNMCLPPLQWQTYDIDFTAAKWDGDKKTASAKVTVKHNGVVVQDNVEITGPTGGGQKEGPTPGSVQFQGHGNPVVYRNVWIIDKK